MTTDKNGKEEFHCIECKKDFKSKSGFSGHNRWNHPKNVSVTIENKNAISLLEQCDRQINYWTALKEGIQNLASGKGVV